MKKIKTIFGLVAIVAVSFLSVSQTHAEVISPNILIGQNQTIGSSGQNVVMLQSLLSELGYLNIPKNIPFGYYGSLTRAAVSRYQTAINVAPAVGYYGPLTKVGMYSDFANHGYLNILGWNN